MPSFPRWTFLLLLLGLLATASANNNHNNNNNDGKNDNNDGNNDNPGEDPETQSPNTPTLFVPTPETFVESAAATDTAFMTPPVKMSFWSTPHRDWDATLLMRLQGLVTRFSNTPLLTFHPHQGIIDGGLIGCHKTNGHHTDITKLTDDCLANCVNVGRYCAVYFPELQDQAHAGLTGADLVMEGARRLCVWINYGKNNPHYYFEYIRALRDSNCDLSLTDNCIDRVYRQVGIDEHDMAQCIHTAGGVGSQIDTKNAILQQEMHRSSNLNLTFADLPHVSLSGMAVENITTFSDWQILAEVCTAFGDPKPAICDFCLRECPIGNDDHDPTQQCLWDLTCGDDRTFDDWMQGTGFFANLTSSNTTDEDVGEDNTAEEQQGESTMAATTASPTASSTATPTVAPTKASDDDDIELPVDNVEDPLLWSNATNATTIFEEVILPPMMGNNDTNATLPPPPPHHNHPTPAVHKTPQPTSAPHHGYNAPVAPLKPTTHDHTHHVPPPTSHKGTGMQHTPQKHKKAANTTDPASAVEGLALAVVCLGGLVAAVYFVRRYRTGKDVRFVKVDRDASGLASTASHAAEQDLELHVEITDRSHSRSDGYAPPAKGTWG